MGRPKVNMYGKPGAELSEIQRSIGIIKKRRIFI
jgi:hypothetical protein